MNLSIIGFDMKKIFRRLACCSFLSIASIGCFDAEARVTKEVAEAVLPYLMEAAGIEEDIGPRNQDGKPYYLHNKIQAILDMIYTDEGQQQMVNWVRSGDFPHILSNVGFNSVNTYRIEQDNLQLLFPCGPGTFSSYATHISRLGYHTLKNGNPINTCQQLFGQQVQPIANVNVADVLNALGSLYKGQMPTRPKLQNLIQYLGIPLEERVDNTQKLQRIADSLPIQLGETTNQQQMLQCFQNNPFVQNKISDVIINVTLSTAGDVDTKLAIILFVLDICDNANQIFDILDALHANIPSYQVPGDDTAGTRDIIQILSRYNEYNYRPVSATSVNGQGDCVQTLYRHLINIAIQNDADNPRNLNIDHLPQRLQEYYSPRQYGDVRNHVISIPATHTEAGKTELDKHSMWNRQLKASVPEGTNIDNATIDDIVNVLKMVSPKQGTLISFGQSTLGIRNARELDQDFAPTIQSSQTQLINAIKMQDALNGIDGRCNNNDFSRRFIANIQLNPQNAGSNAIIEITDRLWRRRITLGVLTNRHAEIIEIQ